MDYSEKRSAGVFMTPALETRPEENEVPSMPPLVSSKAVRVKPSVLDEGVAPSGALRASIGTKIDTTLVPYAMICYAAAGLNYGADKYARRNFEKGFPLSSLLMSIERHTRALMNGEEYDSGLNGSQLPHVYLLASSIAMLCENHESGSLEIDIIQRKSAIPHRTATDIAIAAKRTEDIAYANR